MSLAEHNDVFVRPDLLPERLAEWLRDAIVAGVFQPGERLVEQALCKRFGVSRVPLREALRIVAGDGLVVLSPHRGATVTPLSEVELEELFSLRIALEGLGAGVAAGVRPCPALPGLRMMVGQMRAAVDAGELEAYHALAGHFHGDLVRAAGNAVLTETYGRLQVRFRRYQAAMARVPDLPAQSIVDHTAILDAVEQGAADEARALAEEHVRGLVRRYRGRNA
jgi:DNA-binding GntR family transcriptional regulator